MLKPSFHKVLIAITFAVCLTSCGEKHQDPTQVLAQENIQEENTPFFKISLAQWSFNRSICEGEMDPFDFAQKARELGFKGVEYVSSFYAGNIREAEDPQAEMLEVLEILKTKSEEFEVENLLIMVDEEGDLSVTNEEKRDQAVKNHKKWIDAANFLGCHSIRINLFGSEDEEEWKANSIDALRKLSEYAATKNINVLVENHGGFSSNAGLLAEVIAGVNLSNCGTLPDFGNFCLKKEGSFDGEGPCIQEYPRYKGVKQMMPYAEAVSAKSYDFNEAGQEKTIDYSKMLEIVKEAGYIGFIGVEYEGTDLPPEEGIKATKKLLLNSAKGL